MKKQESGQQHYVTFYRKQNMKTNCRAVPVVEADELSFERRMLNWRDTVRGTSGGGGGCCSGWAAAYVAARNKREEALAISLQINESRSLLSRVDVNELDGWLVEAAVRTMIKFDERQALRLRYVWEYPDHFIRTRLVIRESALRMIFARGITNLKLVLEKLDSPVKIRTYNSHAGIVPRLEALAVPVGTPAPLERKEALLTE
jgi:hypothetical protein